ncbi:MAG: FKBP-type peptidyl-prolyl cis-trans isomerase [Myxococcales bacterium]|nr:FKBP-type peptidyl-prolyl cis-trans isomerase [Myxococcales bacterium]
MNEFEKYVVISTTQAGDGKTTPKPGDMVTCHYTLTIDGRKVDSSRDRNRPFQFNIGRGQVIKGWDEGLLRFTLGQRGIVTIQYQYGYGEAGRPPQVPPKATLVFDVELLGIN